MFLDPGLDASDPGEGNLALDTLVHCVCPSNARCSLRCLDTDWMSHNVDETDEI